MSELIRLTIAETAPLIRERKLSPVELTGACLTRVEAVEPRINAFITVTAEEARTSARRAADEIARGEYRGPLHGIPVALKDLFATAGVRTTAGSKIMADSVPDADSDPTARLRAAGAVLLGKLNQHGSLRRHGRQPHYGACRNPWDGWPHHWRFQLGSGAALQQADAQGARRNTGGSMRISVPLRRRWAETDLRACERRAASRTVLPP
jgi:aspartyl-tRNA(Asn)/glutamyl-tRNA(Gln) amidotransferase subunit A